MGFPRIIPVGPMEWQGPEGRQEEPVTEESCGGQRPEPHAR